MSETTTGRAKSAHPDWLAERLAKIRVAGGYQKPERPPEALKLDSNENYVISEQMQEDVITAARKSADIRGYPLGETDALIGALSRAAEVPPDMISIGNGSDQILDMLLAHMTRRKGTRILTSDPTFSFFEDRSRLYGIPLVKVPFADSMTLDASAILERADGADIIYLDSPNNPTGFQFPKADIQRIVREFGGLVIVDEAYCEFADYTVAGMTRRHGNLIVVRTMSKSFGLAGLRLGYMISDRAIAQAFTGIVQYPYPLSTITIRAGIEALNQTGRMRESVNIIRSERARIISSLREYDAFEVFDSAANFVLFDARGAYRRVHSALAEQGISIRRLGAVGGRTGCLRVTVGTHEMNSRFLLAIRDLLR